MTNLQEDRWNRKVYVGITRLNYEGEDDVGCRIHGARQPFVWVADSDGYNRVCEQCLPDMGLDVLHSPQKLGHDGPFVCEVQTCFNDAIPTPCTQCKQLRCIVHMEDDGLCTDCEDNAEHLHQMLY